MKNQIGTNWMQLADSDIVYLNGHEYWIAPLTFDYAYRRYSATRSDSLKVYISTDCGSTWNFLASYGENGSGNYATGTINQTSHFSPSSSSDWCGGANASCKSVNLNSYVGNSGVKIKTKSNFSIHH